MNQKKTERAWSIKDVSHGQKKKFSCGTNVGSQSERRIRFILPARGFSRIKRTVIGQVLFWRFENREKKSKINIDIKAILVNKEFINWPKRHLFLRDRKRARHTHLSLSASQSDWSIRFISSRARDTIRIISIVPFCSYSVFRYVHYANQITTESNLSQRPQ